MAPSEPAPPPLGAYANAMTVGGVCYVSGQVPVDQAGQTVGVGDPETQARQVFGNLRAVLAEQGLTLDDVVALNTYLTRAADGASVSAVRLEFFGEHRPTSTVVCVAGLLRPDWLLEVSAIAVPTAGSLR